MSGNDNRRDYLQDDNLARAAREAALNRSEAPFLSFDTEHRARRVAVEMSVNMADEGLLFEVRPSEHVTDWWDLHAVLVPLFQQGDVLVGDNEDILIARAKDRGGFIYVRASASVTSATSNAHRRNKYISAKLAAQGRFVSRQFGNNKSGVFFELHDRNTNQEDQE